MSPITPSKVAIISGGSGFVGSAIAKRLAADGYRIAILYHTTPEKVAQDLLAVLPGSSHKAYLCNLATPGDISQTIDDVMRDFGGIDVCLHVAESKLNRSHLLALSSEQFQEQFAVGVFGGFNFLSKVAHVMREGGAMIGITTSAIEAGETVDKMGAYIPAKYALRGMLRVFARELGPRKIRVYAVAPGFLPAGLNSDLPPAVSQFLFEKTCGTNPVTVDDVAARVASLCSADTKFDTGVSVLVSSGKVTEL